MRRFHHPHNMLYYSIVMICMFGCCVRVHCWSKVNIPWTSNDHYIPLAQIGAQGQRLALKMAGWKWTQLYRGKRAWTARNCHGTQMNVVKLICWRADSVCGETAHTPPDADPTVGFPCDPVKRPRNCRYVQNRQTDKCLTSLRKICNDFRSPEHNWTVTEQDLIIKWCTDMETVKSVGILSTLGKGS